MFVTGFFVFNVHHIQVNHEVLRTTLASHRDQAHHTAGPYLSNPFPTSRVGSLTTAS